MTEDAAIHIDQTIVQSVYTCTQLGVAPGGDQPIEPILPCELSVVIEDHVWFEDRWMVASLCDE
jgi:hypothetical protein